ncbi:MAG: hypothetical protein V4663_12875 [Bacteroidota bacterium]
MKQFLFLFLCISVTYASAQKTITKRGYNGKPYEQYQVDVNGTYHGFYKRFFDNGFLENDAVYHKGIQVSGKTYEYYGKVRYLMNDITWDRKGNVLTSKHRTIDYNTGNVGQLIQNKGLLANGKDRWTWSNYFGSGDYSEYYHGNDTVYTWSDRTKKNFVGKYFNGERVLTKTEITAKLAEEAVIKAAAKVKDKEDSIVNVKRMEERVLNEQRAKDSYAEKSNRTDSLAHAKNFAKTTDTLYRKLIISHYTGYENIFYDKMAKYLQNKRNVDTTLQKLITDVIGIKYADLSKYKITTGRSNDIENEYGIWTIVKNDNKTYKFLPLCFNDNRNRYSSSELQAVHKNKVALIAIINYVLTSNIVL